MEYQVNKLVFILGALWAIWAIWFAVMGYLELRERRKAGYLRIPRQGFCLIQDRSEYLRGPYNDWED